MTSTTLKEERAEIWSSILDSALDPDPDRAAACAYLLHHLIDSAVKQQRLALSN